MDEAERMRHLAAYLNQVRVGLADLLAGVVSRHMPGVWASKSADSSRLLLARMRLPTLLAADRAIADASQQLLTHAAVLDAIGKGD